MTTVATSYWPADTSEPVLETTVGGVLREAAAAGPDMIAMAGGLPDPALVPEFRSPMGKFLDEIRPDVPALRDVVYFTEWADFLATAPDQVELPEVRPDDIAQIQYTSGTTGFPEGAELHHRGLTNNARFYAGRLGLQPGEAYVNPMPLFHTAGVVAAYVRLGPGIPGQPAPSPEELRAYCREHLAPYKTPQHWVFVDAFPMTPSGKIQKYKLRESFTANPSP